MPWDLTRGLVGPVFGQGRILHARQESSDLEKKELPVDLVVLAILRVSLAAVCLRRIRGLFTTHS